MKPSTEDKWTKSDRNLFNFMSARGMTQQQVASIFGIERHAVCAIRQRQQDPYRTFKRRRRELLGITKHVK